jgi:hypothetical protein
MLSTSDGKRPILGQRAADHHEAIFVIKMEDAGG